MQTPRLSKPEEILPAYEDIEHMVRRVVREELAPIVAMLQEVKGAEVKIDQKLDGRLRLVTG